MHGDSISLSQRKNLPRRRSTADESLSTSISESSRSSRRFHEHAPIFPTRLDYALVIIGLQTSVTQLLFIFMKVEKYGEAFTFLTMFVFTIFISLPLMVQQMFYGAYNKFGYIKFWHIAPVGFGIGLSMALYSLYECVIWAAIAGLLILNICRIPFRNISEWTICDSNIQRPEGVKCYDAQSNLSGSSSCNLTTYPGLEFYKEISYKPQQSNGANDINSGWFVCCLIVWLLVFFMVSQGFRRLKHILIKGPVVCLLSLGLLALFSLGGQSKQNNEHEENIFHVEESPSRYDMVWLVWHAIRVVQIPLGTLAQLGSYSPSGSPLLADAVMILLFVCFYNFSFVYFAHSCHASIETTFADIDHRCLATDDMMALFASIPTAISFLAMGNLWLFVYFTAFALKTVTQIVITLTATMNAMSEVFHLHRRRQQIVAILCAVALLLDLPLTMTNSEIFFKRLSQRIELIVDLFIVSISSLIILCFYTMTRVFDDIHFAYNSEPVMFLKIILYLAPVLMTFVLITMFTSLIPQWHADPWVSDNPWANAFIGLTAFLLLAPIPAFAVYIYFVHLMKHNILAILQPTGNWGPPEPELKRARLKFNPRFELRYKSKKPCTHNCLLNNLRIKLEVEKRDIQRKEFFINIVKSPSFAEWGDAEDWHHGYDIIGKAQAVDRTGDFETPQTRTFNESQGVSKSMKDLDESALTVKKKDEGQKENESNERDNEKMSVEDFATVKENVNLEGDEDDDVKTEGNNTTVNFILQEMFILNKNTRTESETDFASDIILPNLDSCGPHPRIQSLDTHDVVAQMQLPPYYIGGYSMNNQRRRSRQETTVGISLTEPPKATKMYKDGDKTSMRQSKSRSCQTNRRLKNFRKLLETRLTSWKRSKSKTQRCVGTSKSEWSSTDCGKPRVSDASSEESKTSSETEQWP